ncbi:MAG: cellulose synthase family protein [Planctomycetota bacterium]
MDDWAELAHTVFMTVYTVMLVMVSLYGLHRWALVMLFYRHRRKAPRLRRRFEQLPTVTIQLPMYNEQCVARRIIEKVCEIDYPREKLQIQVLDDSTDGTPEIARQAVEQARQKGFDIEYIHRDNREGYKSGALQNGLKTAKGEFITIFDADFVPEPDFLHRSMHYFTDPNICVVQTRWDHLNRNDSLLTRSQAIFLDGHFAIEHVARNRSRRFMAFNGTAGTWRRTAIEDAGGWQHDTLTEDLDLSIRAQMKGWKFVFLPELTSPAELPPDMNAFKAQQFRWTKGGAQTALKLLPRLLLSRLPLPIKVEGFFQLTAFSLHLFMLVLVLLMFPALYLRTTFIDDGTIWRSLFDLSVFTLATLSAGVFYFASQMELTGDWRTPFKFFPLMMALGVGLSVSNTKAILEAWLGKKSEFVRTPKYGGDKPAGTARSSSKRRKRNLLPYVEFLFGVYMSVCVVASLINFRAAPSTPFLVMFAFGFFYVSISSLIAERSPAPGEVPQPAVEQAAGN